jgi:hypothetical protein
VTADPELGLALELPLYTPPDPTTILSLSKPVMELGEYRGMGALMVRVLSGDGLPSLEEPVDDADPPLLCLRCLLVAGGGRILSSSSVESRPGMRIRERKENIFESSVRPCCGRSSIESMKRSK